MADAARKRARPHPVPSSHDRSGAEGRQPARALVLCGENRAPDDRNLAALLDFFCIPWEAVSIGEISGRGLPASIDRSGYCVLASGRRFAETIQGLATSSSSLPDWMMGARSIYISGFQDSELCRELLRLLTGDTDANIRGLHMSETVMSITNACPAICGPMSGLRVPVKLADGELVFDVHRRDQGFQGIITANDGTLFVGTRYRGTQFYLNACCETVAIGSPSTQYFDVRNSFSSAVPATMYLKWAFRDVCWSGSETSGCLIVDDPLLKPRYGFLQYSDALDLMDRHNFTTTIAFIPWNWRRTSRRTVGMFQQHSDKLSVAVHGCDHTAGEFASRSTALLNNRIKTASLRMARFRQRTSLGYDDVMVFPQGAFSPETGRALKLNGFVAAVNTEVAPSKDASNETTIADLWDLAIMKYGTFPIFTRRYLTHGVANFAFDALLGKPCLVVAHHDVFRNNARDLVDFIAKLNSLKWSLRWRTLGSAVTHSFKVRHRPDRTSVIEMYGAQIVLENPFPEPREAVFVKAEGDLDCVKAVMVNEKLIDWSGEGEYLTFKVAVSSRERAQVRVIYFDRLDVDATSVGIGNRMRTRGRRYLSELRDNYLSQSDFLYESAVKVKRLLQ